jgi:hypothetical protein
MDEAKLSGVRRVGVAAKDGTAPLRYGAEERSRVRKVMAARTNRYGLSRSPYCSA